MVTMNKVDILGVKIDSLTQEQVLQKIESSEGAQIITANPEIVLEAWRNEEYQKLINGSTMVLADGIGLLWAAKFLSLKSEYLLTSIIQMMASGARLVFAPDYCRQVLPERITGVDLMEKICGLSAEKNWKVYLLGGERGIAEKTAEVLQSRYLSLKIAGAQQGFENYLAGMPVNIQAEKITQSKADILFVAMGSPKQDFFIKQILPQLPSVKMAMGVGGAFDFIAGKAKRAPLIYQDLGIEWLWRLCVEPWRFLRIFNATVKFIIAVVRFKHLAK